MKNEWIQLLPERAQVEAQAQLDRLTFLEKKVALLEEMLRLRRLERYGRKSESLTETQLWLMAEELSLSLQELEQEAQAAEANPAVSQP